MRGWKLAAGFAALVVLVLVGLRLAAPERPEGGSPRDLLPSEDSQVAAPAAAQRPVDEKPVPGAALVLVLDGRGQPVAGARVEAVPARDRVDWRNPPPDDRPAVAGSTGPDGRVRLDPLAPGLWSFRARASAGATHTARAVRIESRGTAEVRLVLRRVHVLGGTVRDPDGEPAPGAVVSVRPLRREELRRSASAGPDGVYRIEGLPEGPYEIAAAPPGGVLAPVGELLLPDTTVWNVRLRRRGSARGRVTLASDGAPAAGATVLAGTPLVTMETATDADGRWRIDGIPVRCPTQFAARLAGHVPPEEETEFVWHYLAPGGEIVVDFALRRGASLRGTVRDPAGRPVADAAVEVLTESSWNRGSRRETRTDGAGAYRVETLPSGWALVTVRAPGLRIRGLPARPRDAFSSDHVGPPRPVEIPPEGVVRCDVQLVATANVRGSVREPDGSAVPGARLVARQPVRDRELATTVADGQGAFDLDVPPDTNLLVEATHAGRAAARSTPLALSSGQCREGLELVLRAAPVLRGSVRTDDGRPLVAATVRVADLGEDEPPERYGLEWSASRPVGPDGRFEIPMDGRGSWFAVEAIAADRAPATTEPRPVPPPGEIVEVELVLPSPKMLEGRVITAAEGRAVPDARVFSWCGVGLGDESSRTDARGRFRIALRPDASDVDLHVSSPGFAPFRREPVDLEAGAVLVELRRAVPIRVRVVDTTGEPIHGIEVDVTAKSGAPWRTRTTDARGEILVEEFPDGEYRASTRSTGDWLKAGSAVFTAGRGDVILTVERARRITGRVVDGARRGLPGVRVSARDRAGHGAATRSDGDGSFLLGGLREGDHDVTAGRPGGDHVPRTIPAVPSGTRDLRIELEAGLTIRGRIVDSTGKPVTGLDSRLSFAKEGDRDFAAWGTLRNDGTFELRGLPPGTYVIFFSPYRYEPWLGARVEGVEAGSEGVRIATRRAGRITGSVVDEAGRPVEDVSLLAIRAKDPVFALTDVGDAEAWGEAGTDHRGRFELTGFPPEHRYLVVAGGGGDEWSAAAVADVASGTEGLRFVIRKGRTVRGKLLDAAGKPVRGALLGTFDAKGLPTAWCETRRHGDFALHGLPATALKLEAILEAGGARRPLGSVGAATDTATFRLPR